VAAIADTLLAMLWGGWRLHRLGGGGFFLRGLLRRMMSGWLALEVLFYAYFLARRRSLQQRRHLPPMLHQSAAGRRVKALREALRQLEKVIDPCCHSICDADTPSAFSPLRRRPRQGQQQQQPQQQQQQQHPAEVEARTAATAE
ncbi:unnamed protein product, partial [Polarella glacialis]